jgi:hypothetical protein
LVIDGRRSDVPGRPSSSSEIAMFCQLARARFIILPAILVVTGAVVLIAQPAAAPDVHKPLLTLNADAAIITVLIKPDKTADFELVLAKLKDALTRSEKPERRQQAAGWHVYRSSQLMNGSAAYIMRIEPVVRGQEYDITRLIAEVFPVEVQEIFPKYRDAFAGRAIAEVTPVLSMQP